MGNPPFPIGNDTSLKWWIFHCYLSFYQRLKRLVETKSCQFQLGLRWSHQWLRWPHVLFLRVSVGLPWNLCCGRSFQRPDFQYGKTHAIWTFLWNLQVTFKHQKRPAQWIGCMDFLRFGIVAAQAEALQCAKWPAWESSIVVLRQFSKTRLVYIKHFEAKHFPSRKQRLRMNFKDKAHNFHIPQKNLTRALAYMMKST